MIKLLLTATLGLAVTTTRSQSIFQLTEQLAYDVQKLASIKSTLQEMYQGYEDLQRGYTRVRDLVKDNFNLHEVFLDALWLVSSAVQSDPRLADILNTEYRILAVYKTVTAGSSSSFVWTAQEQGYIGGTLGAVLQRSQQAVDELTMVTTDNELRMSDAERLAAIGRIDAEVREELAFMDRFNNELTIEAARRNQEGNDINTLKSLYGLSH